ncbi:hypothetical protein L195_g016559 [Trifolium pratense]|uniref:Uncharacterized protein n=1 Tax=Trifolium pratense TaxID=57577 RepID=A0A2K3MRH7_TRIPR|nr:hypothetical protein L195_g016559 [Trifolium pratense]
MIYGSTERLQGPHISINICFVEIASFLASDLRCNLRISVYASLTSFPALISVLCDGIVSILDFPGFAPLQETVLNNGRQEKKK